MRLYEICQLMEAAALTPNEVNDQLDQGIKKMFPGKSTDKLVRLARAAYQKQNPRTAEQQHAAINNALVHVYNQATSQSSKSSQKGTNNNQNADHVTGTSSGQGGGGREYHRDPFGRFTSRDKHPLAKAGRLVPKKVKKVAGAIGGYVGGVAQNKKAEFKYGQQKASGVADWLAGSRKKSSRGR